MPRRHVAKNYYLHTQVNFQPVTCSICCMKTITLGFYSCGHVLCQDCGTKLPRCPFCRVGRNYSIILFRCSQGYEKRIVLQEAKLLISANTIFINQCYHYECKTCFPLKLFFNYHSNFSWYMNLVLVLVHYFFTITQF